MNRWNSILRPFAILVALAALALPARADTLSLAYDADFPCSMDVDTTLDFDAIRGDTSASKQIRASSSDSTVVAVQVGARTAAIGKDTVTFTLIARKAGTATITVTIANDAESTASFPVTVTGTGSESQFKFSDETGTLVSSRTVFMSEGVTRTILVSPPVDAIVTCSSADVADHLSYDSGAGALRLTGLDGPWNGQLVFSDPGNEYEDTILSVMVTNQPPRISGKPSSDDPLPVGRKILKNKIYEFPANFFHPQDVAKDLDKIRLTWNGVTIGMDGVFSNSWASATEEGEYEIFSVTIDDGNDTYTGWYSVQVVDTVPLYTDTTAPWAGLVKNGGIAQNTTFTMLDSTGDPIAWSIIDGRIGRALVFPKDSVIVRADLEEGSYPFGWYGSTEYLRAPNATRVPSPNIRTVVSMPEEGDVTIQYFASYPYYTQTPYKGAFVNPVLTDAFGDFDGDGLSDTWEDYYFQENMNPTSDRTTELPVGIASGDYGPSGNRDVDWLPTSLFQPAPDGARKIGWPAEDPDNPGVTNRYRVYKYPLDFSTGGESYNKSAYDEKPVYGNFVEYRGLAENRTGDDGEDPEMFVHYAPEFIDRFNTYGPRGNCSGTDPENYDTDGDGFSDGWEFYFWTTIMYRVNPQNWRAWDPTYSLYRVNSASAGIPLLKTDEPVDFTFTIDPTESYVIDPAEGTYKTTYEVDNDVIKANNLIMPIAPGTVRIEFEGSEFYLVTRLGNLTTEGYDALFYQQWGDLDGDGVLDTPAVDDDGNPVLARLDGAWVDALSGHMHIPGWDVLSVLEDAKADDIGMTTPATIAYVRLNGIFTQKHLLSRFDPMNWTDTDMGFVSDVVKGLGLDDRKWDPDSDLDGDGVLDIEEYFLGTDPLHWDTDRDGMPDGWEVQRGLNPISPLNGDGTGPGDNPDEDYMAYDASNTQEHIYAYLADLSNLVYWNGNTYKGFVPGKAATSGAPYTNLREFLYSLYGLQSGLWFDSWRVPVGLPPIYGDGMANFKYGKGIYPVDWPDTTSNPCNNDTDKDGLPDGWAAYVGINPVDGQLVTPLQPPASLADVEGDGLNWYEEFISVAVTNRWPETRTVFIGPNATYTATSTNSVDASGATNSVTSVSGTGTEVTIRGFQWPASLANWTNKRLSTDPWDGDTDGDGIGDMSEFSDDEDRNGDSVEFCNFNPCSVDTDLDWLPDNWEWFMGTYTPVQERGVSTTDPYGPFGDPDGDGLANFQEYLTAACYAWRHDVWYPLDNQQIWQPQERYLGDAKGPMGDWPYDPGVNPAQGPVVRAHRYEPMDFFRVPESVNWISKGLVTMKTLEKRWAATDNESPSINLENLAAFEQRLFEIVTNPFDNGPDGPSKFMDDTRPSVDPVYNTDIVDIPGKKYFQYHSIEEHWAIVHAFEGIQDFLYSYAQCPYSWDAEALNNTPSGVPYTYIPLNDNAVVCGFPGTRPKDMDSDHDGMPDYWEIYHGLNPCYGGCIAISDKAGSEADSDWDGTDNWVMGADPNYVLNLRLIPAPAPSHRAEHVWYPLYPNTMVKQSFGDGVSGSFGLRLERAHYDLVNRPWLAGDPSADCDHDGLNNKEEAYDVFAPDLGSNTDPSPYWLTDITQSYEAFGQKASYVNLYYFCVGGSHYRDDGFGYNPWPDPSDYWWWEFPYTGNTTCNDPPTYLWDFEINEGYDTDNNNISDREELTDVGTRGKTDPQNFDSPMSRKAMYFDGYAACRTQRPFFHDQYALTSFTAEFWVRPEELPAPGKIATLLQRPVMMPVDVISGARAWAVRNTFFIYLDEEGAIHAEVDNDAIEQPANQAVVSSSGRLVPNVWTHVAVVMDSRNDRLTLYLNGKHSASIATSLKPCTGTIMDSSYQNWATSDGENGIQTVSTTTVNFDYSPAPIVVGAYDTTPWSVIGLNPDATFDENRFFKGWIDEIRIWDRCRTPSEIVNNMTKRFTKEDIAPINHARFVWDVEHLYATNAEDDFPQKVLYHYSFDDLPDLVPADDRPSGMVFSSDTDPLPDGWSKISATRPVAYVPWWQATKNKSTVYSSDYSYVPFIANTAAHMPKAPPQGIKEFLPVYDGEWNLAGYRHRLSADWSEELDSEIMSGDTVIGDVSYQFESTGADAIIRPTRLVNTMDPYGDLYSTGVSGGYSVNPWNFGGMLDLYGVYEGTPVHSDMVPLLDAVADIDVPMWDGFGRGSDINALDSDGDGMPDWWEVAHGLDPTDSSGINGAYGDLDGDGLDNYAEYLAGTDPCGYDTNNDGYSDYYSRPDDRSLTYGELYDDGDGMDNAWEIDHGLDPDSFDANQDFDNDGWTNWDEFMAGTDPSSPASFPTPDFSVTYHYPDRDRTEGGVTHYLWSYGEKTTGGDKMGGDFDGEYSRPNHIVGEIGTFGGESMKVQGGMWYATPLEFGHVATATIEVWDPAAPTNSQTYTLTEFNQEIGQFYDKQESKLYLQLESGTLFYTADFVGKRYSVDYELDGYAYPVTFDGLVRTKDTHVVSGPNRFFGFIDRNDNGTFDLSEPGGLSLYRPTLVGWDSVNAEVYLTDGLWDYPRVSWAEGVEAVKTFVPNTYLVTFTYIADSSAWDETETTTNETTTITGNGIAFGDRDGDGLDPYQEAQAGTDLNNAFSADTTKKRLDYDAPGPDGLTYGEKYDDGDLMPVQWEAANNLDVDRFGADFDPDDDGWTSYEEYIGKTWPTVARSFPMPVMELKYLYAGEVVSNIVLSALTYSERKQGTYLDGNASSSIYMGGWYDGRYTTMVPYIAASAANGVSGSSYSPGSMFLVCDGIFGEDGVQTVQNIEFSVSYVPHAQVAAWQSIVGSSLASYEPSARTPSISIEVFDLSDGGVVANGLLGPVIAGTPLGGNVESLNQEMGMFSLSREMFHGFTGTSNAVPTGEKVDTTKYYDPGSRELKDAPVYQTEEGLFIGRDTQTARWTYGEITELPLGEMDVNEGGVFFKYETGAILAWGKFANGFYGYRITSEQTSGFVFPVTVGAWYRDDGTPNPISSWFQSDDGAHTHVVGGYNRILGFSDINMNGMPDPIDENGKPFEPMGLSLYNSVLAGPDSFQATIPLTDQLFGFPRFSWSPSTNLNVTTYRVSIKNGGVPICDDILVEAPRTFIHEGDYLAAGLQGLDFGDGYSGELDWSVEAENKANGEDSGTDKEIVGSGTLHFAIAPNNGPRRTMKAVAPIAGSTVYGSLVEFMWEMDWRTEGVFFTVKNASGNAVAGLNNLYVPLPVRHNKVTDDDYYYTYIPQLENGRSMVHLPSGSYTYEIRENINTTAVEPQKVTGSFVINNTEDESRTRAAIKGHIHYYGRLPSASIPGKVVVEAYKVSNRARTSLSVGGSPVARTTVNSDGSFELHGLKPGTYGVIGWVDADGDGKYKDEDTKGFGFLGGSASPIQIPQWCVPLVITNAPNYVACDVEDVHVVLRDRDTDSNTVPNDDGFTGKTLAQYKTMALRTFPDSVPAGFDWISPSLFSTTAVQRATTSSTISSTTTTYYEYEYVTKQFAVTAPRTFLHEWDIARTGLLGFNLGKTNAINVKWTVDATDGYQSSLIASGDFVVNAGQAPGSATDPRRTVRPIYPTQLTVVNGNYAEFKWEMDWRNAGVKFGITNIVTGEGVERTVLFPIRHGKTTTTDYYFTAIPQLEDGIAFLDLPRDPNNFFTNQYTYTITEIPRTTMFPAQSVTERFTLVSDDSSRARYSIEGNVKYFGKLMTEAEPVSLGNAAAGSETFSAVIAAADLEGLLRGASAIQLRQGDDVVCSFSDNGGSGALAVDGSEESVGWSGSINYENGALFLRFSAPLEAAYAVQLVRRVFPDDAPLYIRAYRIPDSAMSAVSLSGPCVAQVKNISKGEFSLSGLEQGTYAVHAFIDSDGDGYADDWETQGFGVVDGTDAPVLDSRSKAIVVKTNVKNVMIVLHDRDTDNDLLPDAWEWWRFGNLDTSGYDQAAPGGAFVWQEYADGILDSDPRTPDTDLDGLTDAMELLVTRTNTHKRDTDGDGVGDLEEFLSGSDPLDADDAVPYTVPALAFDADGQPFVEIPYPSIQPGVVLTYELQRKETLADESWETVCEHEVVNDGSADLVGASDGVSAHMTAPGVALLKPAEKAEDVDFNSGFFRIKVYADYGRMVDNGDGTWSYWTWVRHGTDRWDYEEAARGKGTLVRDADGNWSFVSDATGRKGVLVRNEDGTWTFQD